jgi:hypothetical protein
MHMKKVIVLFLALVILSPVHANAGSPTFVITSECITSADIEESDFMPEAGWRLIINIDASTAAELHTFSGNNIGTKVHIVDGVGNELINGGAVIMDRISSPIVISWFKSKNKAVDARNSVLSTKGVCGDK